MSVCAFAQCTVGNRNLTKWNVGEAMVVARPVHTVFCAASALAIDFTFAPYKCYTASLHRLLRASETGKDTGSGVSIESLGKGASCLQLLIFGGDASLG